MKIIMQTTCSYKNHAYNSEINIQTNSDSEDAVAIVNDRKYPTEKMLKYCIRQTDIGAKWHFKEARNEMLSLRFVRKNKLNLFSLITFVFDGNEEWLVTYFYDHKSKKIIQLFTVYNDFVSSDLSEIYGNIANAVAPYGVIIN